MNADEGESYERNKFRSDLTAALAQIQPIIRAYLFLAAHNVLPGSPNQTSAPSQEGVGRAGEAPNP